MVGKVGLNFGWVTFTLLGNLVWKTDFYENNF